MSEILSKGFERVARVIAWDNGQVMVFDPRGNQIPVLQGRLPKVGDLVLAAADSGTTFDVGAFPNTMASTRSAFYMASRPALKPCARCGHDPVDRSVF